MGEAVCAGGLSLLHICSVSYACWRKCAQFMCGLPGPLSLCREALGFPAAILRCSGVQGSGDAAVCFGAL